MEILAAIVGGSFGAAIVSLVQFLIVRHDKKKAGEVQSDLEAYMKEG